jgi:hypothetical protein
VRRSESNVKISVEHHCAFEPCQRIYSRFYSHTCCLLTKFSMLDGEGTLRRNKQGWPLFWSWQTDDRKSFIKTVTRFSGNHAQHFGRLLTPLVNGVRVAGSFVPGWNGAR